MTELHEALEALPCRHMLAILDCCFAGAFRWSSKRDFQPLPPVIYKERYDRFIRDAAWQVITSASYDQKALDILSGTMRGEQDARQGQQHSPFALALFDALGGAADTTPKDGDGVITATELYLYLRDEVEVPAEELAAHRQTPGLWPLNRHEHGEFIFLVPGHELNLPPAPDLTEKNNPYKGLSPYEKGDSELFFGRTDLVKKLKRRVAKLPFTVVLGASGTGKSSLVKAGLLPALEHGANKEKQSAEENDASQPSSWFILERVTEKDGKKKKEVMRPGANPLATLRSLLINDLPGVRPERKGGATPAGMIGQWRKKNPGLKLLLVIDQFEELITLCREEQARKDFIRELRQALDEHSKVLRIVLTLRSDFEAQISQNYLKECWRQNYRFVVPPMTQDELREVIEEPASLRVLYFEPRNLVDDLINEVVQTPGSLPLLSFTLSELYRRYVKRQKDVKQQDGNRALTKADYEKMGGIIGSLRSRIEQKYNELDVAQKKTLRRILLRMVAFEGGELTRRQAPEWEFTYPSVKETKEVKELLKGLTKNRLIVVDERNDAKGKAEPYYEAVHDSLIVAWDKMFEWRDNEAEKMLLHRQLTRAAGDWKRGENEKERKALLWDNSPRLLRVQEFLEQEDSGDMGDGTKVERKQRSFRLLRQFYKNLFPSFAPLDQHVWLNRVETDFVRRSVERKRNWTRGVSVFISVIIVTLIAAWWITNDARIEAKNQQGRAETARDEADKERKNAVSALNKANNNIGLALNEKGKDAEDRRCNAFTHFYSLHALTKISKEKEEAYGEALLRALGNPVQLPVVTIAINSSHDLWIQYLEDTAPIFLPDDRTLATDTGFWDAVTGKVVNADDETHAFWDMIVELRSRKEPWDSLGLLPEKSATMLKRSLEADRVGAAPLVNMALSPDNRILAAGYYDGYSSAWDVLNGRRLLASKKFGRSIAFSPDGNVLATGPILWDITTSNRLLELNLAGYKTTFSHDGLTLVTSSNDTAYLWDISAYNRQIAVLKDNLATSMTFSFDGRMLATGSGGNTIHLWDTATGKSFKTQTVDNHVETLSFSPTDYILAAAISDNTVVLLDVSTGNLLRILHVEKTSDQVETGNELDVKSMVFSPDGHMIATGLSNGIVVIWNTVMGNRLMTLTLGQDRK
uniref:nSTAND1 domain-containing NTPase n=1 Tax=Candidatus Electrothrix sp. TaxID=2170559 RepID=UPI004056D460